MMKKLMYLKKNKVKAMIHADTQKDENFEKNILYYTKIIM